MDPKTVFLDQEMTRRQRQCMALVERGHSSKEIARELGISHRTVEAHIAAVMELLEVNSRMAAVARLKQITDERTKKSSGFMFGSSQITDSFSAALVSFPSQKEEPEQGLDSRILPPFGGAKNAAPLRIRAAWILRIMILSIMTSCMVILIISGLSELVE